MIMSLRTTNNPGLRATFPDGEILKAMFEGLGSLMSDCVAQFSSDGMTINGMDNSHISLVDISFRSEAFTSFRCPLPGALGLHLDSMIKVMKLVKKNDEIKLLCGGGISKDDLTIEIVRQYEKIVFEIRLMNITADELDVQSFEYAVEVEMNAKRWTKTVQDMLVFGRYIRIEWGPNNIKFVGGIGEHGTVVIVNMDQNADVDKDDHNFLRITHHEPSSNFMLQKSFSTAILVKFTKSCANMSQNVILSIGPDIPLRVRYIINRAAHVNYYLAPQIED